LAESTNSSLALWTDESANDLDLEKEIPVDMRGHFVGDDHSLDTVALVRNSVISEDADTVANAPRVLNTIVI